MRRINMPVEDFFKEIEDPTERLQYICDRTVESTNQNRWEWQAEEDDFMRILEEIFRSCQQLQLSSEIQARLVNTLFATATALYKHDLEVHWRSGASGNAMMALGLFKLSAEYHHAPSMESISKIYTDGRHKEYGPHSLDAKERAESLNQAKAWRAKAEEAKKREVKEAKKDDAGSAAQQQSSRRAPGF
jgi:hypothetical protein